MSEITYIKYQTLTQLRTFRTSGDCYKYLRVPSQSYNNVYRKTNYLDTTFGRYMHGRELGLPHSIHNIHLCTEAEAPLMLTYICNPLPQKFLLYSPPKSTSAKILNTTSAKNMRKTEVLTAMVHYTSVNTVYCMRTYIQLMGSTIVHLYELVTNNAKMA